MPSLSALFRWLCTGTLGAVTLLPPSVAAAQTWSAPRTRPSIRELVAVDATGETAWPFGFEDVAGDGSAFPTAERSIDLRSAYAATDQARLWVRAYVSSVAAVDPSLRLYVFIDADGSRSTGGGADATDLEAAFTADPSGGGYEHVLGLSGMGSVLGLWDYDAAQDLFQLDARGTMRAQGEVGLDIDPLRLGEAVRGFLGGNVELSELPLAVSCDGADLFFRAVSDAGNDLEVGPRAACVGDDGNDNRIPDRVEDVPACDSDDDCPASGRCIDGECRYADACAEDAECGAGRRCEDDRCVITGGDGCSSSSTCNGLVCSGGTCTPCTADGVSCAGGEACSPDGRCVPGSAGPAPDSEALVDADERVQGGAFTCGVGGAASNAGLASLALSLLLLRRRRNQREHRRP